MAKSTRFKPGADPRRNRTKPGPGRPPSAIREQCRGSFADRIRVAEQIIDSPHASDADKLRGLDLLARYGGLAQMEHVGADGTQLPAPVVILEARPA